MVDPGGRGRGRTLPAWMTNQEDKAAEKKRSRSPSARRQKRSRSRQRSRSPRRSRSPARRRSRSPRRRSRSRSRDNRHQQQGRPTYGGGQYGGGQADPPPFRRSYGGGGGGYGGGGSKPLPELGTIHKCTVARLQPFGAFVTIDGFADGLIHVSELCSERRVDDVGDFLTVGDTCYAVVAAIKDGSKLSLSMARVDQETKELKGGEDAFVAKRSSGSSSGEPPPLYSVHKARIARIQPFGCFASIEGYPDGLIHVSQLCSYRVEKPEDVVDMGQQVYVKVVEHREMGRVALSMKLVDQATGEDLDPGNSDYQSSGGGGKGNQRQPIIAGDELDPAIAMRNNPSLAAAAAKRFAPKGSSAEYGMLDDGVKTGNGDGHYSAKPEEESNEATSGLMEQLRQVKAASEQRKLEKLAKKAKKLEKKEEKKKKKEEKKKKKKEKKKKNKEKKTKKPSAEEKKKKKKKKKSSDDDGDSSSSSSSSDDDSD